MASAWFIVPFKRAAGGPKPARYCAIDGETPLIRGDGGQWAEAEVLGDRAIVKVRASAQTLAILAAKYKRLPTDKLDDSLAGLSAPAKTAIRNELEGAGYSLAEIQDRFGGDLGQYTLRDVLRFMASRRRKPRYDADTDTIILDGPVQPCLPLEVIDSKVR